MRAEISYDLVMADDMDFVEGTYQLPGAGWQVLIVSRRDVPEPCLSAQSWDSGATGVLIEWPRNEKLNASSIHSVMSAALGVSEWVTVCGPDSMHLR